MIDTIHGKISKSWKNDAAGLLLGVELSQSVRSALQILKKKFDNLEIRLHLNRVHFNGDTAEVHQVSLIQTVLVYVRTICKENCGYLETDVLVLKGVFGLR